MEERLDDAINVLRNHAESQLGLHLGSVGPHGSIYSHTSPPQLDHLVSTIFYPFIYLFIYLYKSKVQKVITRLICLYNDNLFYF